MIKLTFKNIIIVIFIASNNAVTEIIYVFIYNNDVNDQNLHTFKTQFHDVYIKY